ncbi:MAG: type II toxin-antitoxin system RelE/ParE family toxin [Myxococcales bacterium]
MPARDFLSKLPEDQRAQLLADITSFAELGDDAPVIWRWIKGKQNRPMRELKIGAYRVLFVVKDHRMRILEACKKQDQEGAIRLAADRMKLI